MSHYVTLIDDTSVMITAGNITRYWFYFIAYTFITHKYLNIHNKTDYIIKDVKFVIFQFKTKAMTSMYR